MVDTARTVAELLAIFADGQDAGSITEQDVRDLVVSTIGQTGWVDHQDGEYTNASPQPLPSGVATQVSIDGAISRTQEKPFGVADLFDTTTSKIIAPKAGTGMMISFETIIRRTTGTGEWAVDSFIDIGVPVELYPRTISHNKISGDKKITWTTGAYCLDTWVANGGAIMLRPSVEAECYQSRVIIHQTHRGRGAY